MESNKYIVLKTILLYEKNGCCEYETRYFNAGKYIYTQQLVEHCICIGWTLERFVKENEDAIKKIENE